MGKALDPFWNTAENAKQYDEFTRTSFSRIYPVIAGQILERTGITHGTCLDIGSGPAPLAIAVALRSYLHVIALDSSPNMQSFILRNVIARNMRERITPVLGDVHSIPLTRETCDLVISRGSYHFWHDFPGALREVHRILKSGGKAYIGGGYGSSSIRDEVLAKRKERGIVDDQDHPRQRFRKFEASEIKSITEQARFGEYEIINDDSGFWMIFGK